MYLFAFIIYSITTIIISVAMVIPVTMVIYSGHTDVTWDLVIVVIIRKQNVLQLSDHGLKKKLRKAR